MMTDEQLRSEAWKVALGLPNTFNADKIVQQIIEEVEGGLVTWTQESSPSGIRAFNGESKSFRLLAAEANIQGAGVIHRGTAIAKEGSGLKFNVVIIPPQVAEYIYHLATAQRN